MWWNARPLLFKATFWKRKKEKERGSFSWCIAMLVLVLMWGLRFIRKCLRSEMETDYYKQWSLTARGQNGERAESAKRSDDNLRAKLLPARAPQINAGKDSQCARRSHKCQRWGDFYNTVHVQACGAGDLTVLRYSGRRVKLQSFFHIMKRSDSSPSCVIIKKVLHSCFREPTFIQFATDALEKHSGTDRMISQAVLIIL